MTREVILIIAAGLRHVTTGVGAKLTGFGAAGLLGVGDSAPTIDPDTEIFDEITHPEVARGRLPDGIAKGITLSTFRPMDSEGIGTGQPGTRENRAELLVRIFLKSDQSHEAARDASYIARAVGQALRSWFLPEADPLNPVRTLQHVNVYNLARLEHQPLWQELTDTTVIEAMLVTLDVRDLKPMG